MPVGRSHNDWTAWGCPSRRPPSTAPTSSRTVATGAHARPARTTYAGVPSRSFSQPPAASSAARAAGERGEVPVGLVGQGVECRRGEHLDTARQAVESEDAGLACRNHGWCRKEVGSAVALRHAGRACTSFASKRRHLEDRAAAPGTTGPVGTVASTEGQAPHGRGTRRPQGRPPYQGPRPGVAVRPPRTRTTTYFSWRTLS